MAVSTYWNSVKDAVRDSNVLLLPVDAGGSWVVRNEGPLVVNRLTANGDDDGTIAKGSSATLTATTYLFSTDAALRLSRGGSKSRARLGPY